MRRTFSKLWDRLEPAAGFGPRLSLALPLLAALPILAAGPRNPIIEKIVAEVSQDRIGATMQRPLVERGPADRAHKVVGSTPRLVLGAVQQPVPAGQSCSGSR